MCSSRVVNTGEEDVDVVNNEQDVCKPHLVSAPDSAGTRLHADIRIFIWALCNRYRVIGDKHAYANRTPLIRLVHKVRTFSTRRESTTSEV